MLPKISIITPSYNQGHFIEQTIQSVLSQNYPNLEYIIIDGGSTDNSIEVIKKYEKHLSYWISEKDKGQSDAINKGYAVATGEIINWLNSDDYYEAGALHKVGNAFNEPSVNAFLGRSRIFGTGEERLSPGTDLYPDNLAKTLGRARIDQPETFFRKAVWDTIGPLDTGLHYIMDKEFWIRYLYKFGISGIKKAQDILVHFRIHGDSKTGSQKEKFLKETIDLHYTYARQYDVNEVALVLEQQFGAIEINTQHPITPAEKKPVYQALHYFLYFLCQELYFLNDFVAAREILSAIDKKIVSKQENNELQKIAFRMKWLPPSLKRLYHRFV